MLVLPALSLDLDSTINDGSRTNYSRQNQTEQKVPQNYTQTLNPSNLPIINNAQKQQILQDLPKVPKLPSSASSQTVAPINTVYSGNVPNNEAIIPCNDIKVNSLIVDNKIVKSKTESKSQKKKNIQYNYKNYRTVLLPKGIQLRVINESKISDYLLEGQKIVFLTTQEFKTAGLTVPKNTKLIARVEDSHKPQLSCNGGLVGVKFVAIDLNGRSQNIEGKIIKLKTDNVYFSNLKGEHTYMKNVCKKAKWGQKKFNQYSKTSHKLANEGPKVIIAPFPYLAGCALAAASTLSSPATALLAKGGHLTIPPKTVFTMKFCSDTRIIK